MSDRLYRSSPTKPAKPVKGHGDYLDIRIDTKKYPEVIELLKTRTQEEFEKKYKLKLDRIYPWKGFKNRLVAILSSISKRKDISCDDNSLH